MTITQVDALEAMLEHHRTLVEDVDRRIGAIAEAVGRGIPYRAAVAALVTYLAEEVLPHAEAEERSIYRAAGSRADLADTVNGMIAEHRVLASAVESLASRPNGSCRPHPGHADRYVLRRARRKGERTAAPRSTRGQRCGPRRAVGANASYDRSSCGPLDPR